MTASQIGRDLQSNGHVLFGDQRIWRNNCLTGNKKGRYNYDDKVSKLPHKYGYWENNIYVTY